MYGIQSCDSLFETAVVLGCERGYPVESSVPRFSKTVSRHASKRRVVFLQDRGMQGQRYAARLWAGCWMLRRFHSMYVIWRRAM